MKNEKQKKVVRSIYSPTPAAIRCEPKSTLPSKTVPDQGLKIRDVLTKLSRGIEIPQMGSPVYPSDQDAFEIPDLAHAAQDLGKLGRLSKMDKLDIARSAKVTKVKKQAQPPAPAPAPEPKPGA